jgi:DNA-binding transcriptional MocR family regulator
MTNWTPAIADRPGPRYRAIADALAEAVADGGLCTGDRLPTHRDLAVKLGVTVGTVTRAYAEAEKRGLIGGEVGRGTFVLGRKPPPPPRDSLSWPPAATENPAAVNMMVVKPPQRIATAALAETLRDIAADGDALELLGYTPHAGLTRHRAAGADWMNRRHNTLSLQAENVLLAVGAQNAIAIAMAALARPGDVVLTEKLTNYGVKVLAATLGLHLEGVALDEHGLLPDAFDSACRRLGPKLLYTVPSLQNPTGSVMPEERRREIAAVARRYDVVILEDDVFSFLLDGVRPIQAVAPDITVFLTSLSKSVAAGLRVGYLAAPPAMTPRLETAARALLYNAPALTAEVAARWINSGQADKFADHQKEEDAARQKLARAILPPACLHGHPAGEHLWLTLPEPWRGGDFVAETRRRGALVTGADTFVVGRASAPHAVRISLCMPENREDLVRGLRVLADVLNDPTASALSIL